MSDAEKIRGWAFATVKYMVYGILCWNGYQFYIAEAATEGITFSNGLSFVEVINVYSATIDTTFWILLIVLLELETHVIEDDVLKRPLVKFGMIFLRTICYSLIVYALWGYWVKLGFQSDMVPFVIANVCDLVGQNFTILIALEEYVELTAENCQSLAGQDLFRLNGYDIIAPHSDLVFARNVAAIDVVNAATWLGIIAILEVDVWFQLKGGFSGALLRGSNILKGILYSILFVCAVAWGYTGVFLDFSDAALWLFAFFFIEMNLFQWQQETKEEAAAD
jgi:hypothetical protein